MKRSCSALMLAVLFGAAIVPAAAETREYEFQIPVVVSPTSGITIGPKQKLFLACGVNMGTPAKIKVALPDGRKDPDGFGTASYGANDLPPGAVQADGSWVFTAYVRVSTKNSADVYSCSGALGVLGSVGSGGPGAGIDSRSVLDVSGSLPQSGQVRASTVQSKTGWDLRTASPK